MSNTNSKHNEIQFKHAGIGGLRIDSYFTDPAGHATTRYVIESIEQLAQTALSSSLPGGAKQPTRIETVSDCDSRAKANGGTSARAESYLARGVFGLMAMKL